MLPIAPITSTTSTAPSLTTAELNQMALDIADYSRLVQEMDNASDQPPDAQTETEKTD